MRFLYTIIMVFILASPASAQEWPCTYWFEYTTLEENLPVAVEPDLMERYPKALSYPDGCTLVVFWRDEMGICYQIINRYGELFYPGQPALAAPAISTENSYPPKAIPDGSGGAFIVWACVSGSDVGMYAQRLDSLGNRMWGDAGVRIFTWEDSDFDISTDNQGGLFLAVTDDSGSSWDIWGQHLDADGNLLWGSEGLPLIDAPFTQRYPRITYDLGAGCYLVWEDWRPPYSYQGALFMQRFDSDGNPVWTTNGLFICENVYFHQVIPHGQNGFILHTNPNMSNSNTVYRIAFNGTTLWSRDHVSWFSSAKIVEGEPGFFYLGFHYLGGVYGQKMDMQGHTYWPTWGDSLVGACMALLEGSPLSANEDFIYQAPYFYGVYSYERPSSPYAPRRLYAQALDSSGNAVFENNGVLLSYYNTNPCGTFLNKNVVPDNEGGIVCIWEYWEGNTHDVYAKRCNADGTLGGPKPMKVMPPLYPKISGVSHSQVSFDLPEAGLVRLDVFDLLGRKVKTIEEGYFNAGNYAVHYNRGNLASGVYFVWLQAPYGQAAKKVVVVQ